MKLLLSLSAALTLLLGVVWLFFPVFMLNQWAVPSPDPVTVYMSRRMGGLFFGYATLLWLARNAPRSDASRAILAGGAVVTAVMTAVSLVGVLSGVVGPFVWSAVAIEAVLVVAFVHQYRAAAPAGS